MDPVEAEKTQEQKQEYSSQPAVNSSRLRFSGAQPRTSQLPDLPTLAIYEQELDTPWCTHYMHLPNQT